MRILLAILHVFCPRWDSFLTFISEWGTIREKESSVAAMFIFSFFISSFSHTVTNTYLHLLWESGAAWFSILGSMQVAESLRDVLPTAAVLLVHKLLSSLPYCATPCVAKTSRGFPLVSLLYISKESTERITTWSEVEIIARASIASLCFMWWYFRLNPLCCWNRDRKEEGRGGKASFFVDQICACYWI